MSDAAVQKADVIVIGGGAAGFFAALSAKEANPTAHVVILEATNHTLAKVKISGGGRCNVTHACFDPAALVASYPRAHKTLRHLFTQFGPAQTMEWFQSRGVRLKTEVDGRLFPVTDDSQTIIDCLQRERIQLGVALRTGERVQNMIPTASGFSLETESMAGSTRWQAKAVIVATGGSGGGYKLLEGLGLLMVSPAPSLFTFKVDDADLHALQGVSVQHVVGTLIPKEGKPIIQEGPLLVTHWGLSGPCILRLSAWGARLLHEQQYQAQLRLNWWPELTQDAIREWLLATKQEHPKQQAVNQSPPAIPKRLWEYLLTTHGKQANYQPSTLWGDMPNKALNLLAEALVRWPIAVSGKGVFKEEFVTAGGVATAGLNLKTYEAKALPGLFVVGEAVDVDGITGGFNFQHAWTSGWIAGQSVLKTPSHVKG
ncbi:MAG: NAD(P)/FAD-dependent oxidoreductase [Vampirovibrionales bacterium]|nr:NAD(P)/FAD-dependent oxidoreductase [Vampirovibrionales bacterium]